MFRCELDGCNRVTEPGQPVNKIVTEWRQMTYEHKVKRGKHRGEIYTTTGREIAQEIKVCPECYVLKTGEKPVQRHQHVRVEEEVGSVVRPKKARRFNDEGPARQKKWKNPRNNKKGKFAKKEGNVPAEQKKAPVVEVVNPLSQVPIVKE